MAFETTSVFDELEADDTDRRVASRRALALAHNRVETHLGAFFRGAQSEEEFLERLGLVLDDFSYHVTSAADEVGYNSPEHLEASLKSYYQSSVVKQGCGCCGGGKCTCASDCKDCDCNHKESHTAGQTFLANPLLPGAGTGIAPGQNPMAGPQAGGSANMAPTPAAPLPGSPAAPTGTSNSNPNAIQSPADPNMAPQVMQGDPTLQPAIARVWRCAKIEIKPENKGKLHEDLGVPKGEKIPEEKLEEAEHSDDPKERQRAQFAENAKHWNHKGSAPDTDKMDEFEDDDEPDVNWKKKSADEIGLHDLPMGVSACPGCGKVRELDASNGYCANCNLRSAPTQGQGLGQRLQPQMAATAQDTTEQNAGPGPKEHTVDKPQDTTEQRAEGDGASVLDALDHSAAVKTSRWVVAEKGEGNTDLGGPEPKIDKAKQNEDNLKKPESDGEMKDIVDPIKARNREQGGKAQDEVKEIGDIKSEKLPANSGDAGFDDGGETKGLIRQ